MHWKRADTLRCWFFLGSNELSFESFLYDALKSAELSKPLSSCLYETSSLSKDSLWHLLPLNWKRLSVLFAVLRLQYSLTSALIDTTPPNLFNPLALLLLASPTGTECHLLVSSLLGAHLGYWMEWHKEVVPWCLQFRKLWEEVYVCDLMCETYFFYIVYRAYSTLCFQTASLSLVLSPLFCGVWMWFCLVTYIHK